MLKNIYLTIDDSPSVHMGKKVDFLKQNHIPAVFYARGEYIEKQKDQVVYAIKNNFLIGNHSYSHPYFSKIDLKQCIHEIQKTETLIERCYQLAQVERPQKIIRLPFADRGGEKSSQIQTFLKERGFVQLIFQKKDPAFIDSYWDLDTEDYKSKYIQNKELYVDNFIKQYQSYQGDTAVVLLHDFFNNHHLFHATMDFLMKNKVGWLNPGVLK